MCHELVEGPFEFRANVQRYINHNDRSKPSVSLGLVRMGLLALGPDPLEDPSYLVQGSNLEEHVVR